MNPHVEIEGLSKLLADKDRSLLNWIRHRVIQHLEHEGPIGSTRQGHLEGLRI